ncbi:calcium-binding protein [Celeribacter indicus]|uniref:Ca2+-binding protein, RTX toxin n=1 Tax=Celeribacter indicus TaxID=1208324 RepID=A0A0B5E0Z0_9RHOB|nr:calcium-binding protein [Celeribacter indicus]AJE48954.1 Ca2+-binding protein, RTX toxin [Celeribacter indicus]SDW42174.1 Hemolysin-type calcium-binding repeat-containing protein [Celeribacter indicus]
MWLLLALPALLGAAFLLDSDDDDDHHAERSEDTDPPPEDDSTGGATPEEEPSDVLRLTGTEGDNNFRILGDKPYRIDGRGGDDKVRAGPGDNTVFGGAGTDILLGEGGDDRLFGNADPDLVEGGPGNDAIFLGDGNDESGTSILYASTVGELTMALEMQTGDDLIRGGDGDDLIIDIRGSNTIYGDLGDDVLLAYDHEDEHSPDIVHGGYGDDRLAGDDGDTLTGGAGADEIYVASSIDMVKEIVTVTDFDPAEDNLVIDVLGDDLSGVNEDEEIVIRETEDGLILELFEQQVALLQGLRLADLPADTSAMFTISV